MKLAKILIGATLVLSSGCLKKSALFCDEDTPCTNPELPFCDLNGDFPASEGHGRTCIPNPFADAGTPDAAPSFDAAPARPPVINFQPADLVLGQPDFESSAELPRSGSSLSSPRGVGTDGVRLWVSETSGPRVLQWDVMPAVNGQAANIAIGQPNLTSEFSGVSAAFLTAGMAVEGNADLVVVGDLGRVLIWEPVPSASGNSAFRVVGKADFTSTVGSIGQTGIDELNDVCTDGTRIAVSDFWNNRVMIWDSLPSANGQAADLVVGQPTFDSTVDVQPPSRSSLLRPVGLWCDNDRLIVADGNGRVLIWEGWPTTNGQAASTVINEPASDVAVARGSFFLAGVRRILVYTPIPSTDSATPDRVLGQPDFQSLADPATFETSAFRFSAGRIAATQEALFVVDNPRRRVLRFSFLK